MSLANVTFKLYDKDNKMILSKYNTACFTGIWNYKWKYMELDIYVNKNTEYKQFWLNIIKEIEPSVKFNEDSSKVIVPYMGNRGKTLFILTIIRYLWEEVNIYYKIVPMTKKIIELYPNIDKLSAIVIANSSAYDNKSDGNGHSIVNFAAEVIPIIEDYRNYDMYECHKLCNPNDNYGQIDLLHKFKKETNGDLDVQPAINYYIKEKKLCQI